MGHVHDSIPESDHASPASPDRTDGRDAADDGSAEHADGPRRDATGPHTAFRREVRERALDEALRQLNTGGWNSLRMGAVAEAVGVSRPTLYAEFGNKQGLATALVQAEARKFLDGALGVLRSGVDDPPRAIYEAAAFTIAEAGRSRVVLAILAAAPSDGVGVSGGDGKAGLVEADAPSSDSLLASATVASATILEPVFEGVLGWFTEVCPDTELQRREDAVDALIRLASSHVLSPGPRTGDVPATLSRLAVMMLPELAGDSPGQPC